MKAVDMTKIYQNYKGQWVALKSTTDIKVIASAKTLRKVLEESRQKGVENPYVVDIPKRVLPLVGS